MTDSNIKGAPPAQGDDGPNVSGAHGLLSVEESSEIDAARRTRETTCRATVPAIENVLYQPFRVLDRGFVRVVDYMGSDAAVVQAARISYGKGTRQTSDDEKLIRYLLRHRHTTPFEMCEIKLHVKLPIFVARQWIRHRTANVNEYSARYSRLDREFYIPEPENHQSVLEGQVNRRRESRSGTADFFKAAPVTGGGEAFAPQSMTNRQGRGDKLPETENGVETKSSALSRIHWLSTMAYGVYKSLLNEEEAGARRDPDRDGLARELARVVLPVNYFTQFYWKIDLHNLMHFLSLRADEHAQYEIRTYAEVIVDEIVKRWVPLTYQAFQDYTRNAVSLSAGGLDVVRRMLAGEAVEQETSGLSPREWRELMTILDHTR